MNNLNIGNLVDDALPKVLKSKPDKLGDPHAYWKAEDLWRSIPLEFTGAQLSESLIKVLKSKPPSVTLIGPPGTGKTRSLWALVHHLRHRRMEQYLGTEITRGWVSDGEHCRRQESVDEALDRYIAMHERARITDEAGGIRAHRYDRAWLDSIMNYEHIQCIDDIGCIEPNDWVREAIYCISNTRRAQGKTTIWTSNLTSQQFRDTFGAAIASRILGGEVIEVNGSDKRLS